MSGIAPKQIRALDSYFTNTRLPSSVNKLTRAITGGNNVIINPVESFILLKPIIGLGEKNIKVSISPGVAIKDDVLIHILEQYDLDFTIENNYIDEVGGMIENGLYYIVLYYFFLHRYPNPKAYYKIIRNTELFDPFKYLFLGGVYVKNGEIDYRQKFIYMDPNNIKAKRNNSISLECIDGGVVS